MFRSVVISACLALCVSQLALGDQYVAVSLAKNRQIAIFSLDPTLGTLVRRSVIETPGEPGAMCADREGEHLYVVMKKTRSLAAYRIGERAELALLGVVDVGADGSYLSVHPSGKYLLSSYYGAGRVAVHPINADGTLAAKAIQVLETDEKAHAVVLDPTGRFAFVPHTLPDAIFQFRFDSATGMLHPNEPRKLLRKDKSGPRHLWFHPDNGYVYGSDEQGNSVTTYRWDRPTGQLETVETLSSLPAQASSTKNSTSDIEVHPSGKFVYIANRGHNTIAGYTVDSATGKLTLLQHTPTEPVTRSFNISADGRHLVAAGQTSGKLAAFRIETGGTLVRTSTVTAGKAPWWVLFLNQHER